MKAVVFMFQTQGSDPCTRRDVSALPHSSDNMLTHVPPPWGPGDPLLCDN